MICPKCGSKVAPNSAYCPHCGYSFIKIDNTSYYLGNYQLRHKYIKYLIIGWLCAIATIYRLFPLILVSIYCGIKLMSMHYKKSTFQGIILLIASVVLILITIFIFLTVF